MVSVLLPWHSVSVRGGGLFGSASLPSRSITGIDLSTGVAGLLVSLASLGFLGWTYLQRRDLLLIATRIAAGAAGFAFLLALGQALRIFAGSSSGGLAGLVEMSIVVTTALGLYVAMLSSLAAGFAFGAVAFGFQGKIIDRLATTQGAEIGGGAPGLSFKKLPRGAWIALAGSVCLLVVGGGLAWWLLTPRVHLENLTKVRSGMSEDEVQALLGPGEVVSTTTLPGGFNPFSKGGKPTVSKTMRWLEEKGNTKNEVSLTFIDGKVFTGFGPPDEKPKAVGLPDPAAFADAFKSLAKEMSLPAAAQKSASPGAAPAGPKAAKAPEAASSAKVQRPANDAFATAGRAGLSGEINDADAALAALKRGGFDRYRALDWLIAATPTEDRRAEVTTALRLILNGPERGDHPKASTALAAWAGPQQVPALIAVLGDPDANVRRPAIDALGRLKDGQAATPLANRLAEPNDRAAAGRALMAFGNAAAGAVQPFLQSDDRGVRTEAAKILQAIGALPNDGGVMLALADLRDRDNGVKVRALKVLSQARPDSDDTRRPEIASVLEPLLRDSDGWVRTESARALGAWGRPESVPALIDALASDSADLRRASIEALGRLGDKRSVPYIARRLTDGGDRSAATRALQELGPLAEPETVPYLRHDNAAVRAAACRVLQIAGTRKSVQALQVTANDRNREVARAALEALDVISRRKPTKGGTSGR